MCAKQAPSMLAAIKQLQADLRKRAAIAPQLPIRHSPHVSKTLLTIIGITGGTFILFLFLLLFCCVAKKKRWLFGAKAPGDNFLGNFLGPGSKSELSDISDKEGKEAVMGFFLPQPRRKKKLGIRKSVVGRVDPLMYNASSDLESIQFTSGPGLGTVELSIVMECDPGNLIVTIVRVTGLSERAMDKNHREAPSSFVKVTLLPDLVSQQTKVQRMSTDPFFNECVVFSVPPGAVIQKRLRLSVYDVDKKNVRYALGNATIPLEAVDLQEEISYKLPLEKLENVLNTHLGDFELSLTMVPDAGKIKVGVLSFKGFNEFSYDPNSDHNCNVFVRTYMYRGHRMIRFRESSSCRLHSDVFFNEYFNFAVPLRHLDQTHFVFMIILSTDAKDPGVPVGRVEVGSYHFARGEELMHWQQALDNPRTTITMFHMIESPEVTKMTCYNK